MAWAASHRMAILLRGSAAARPRLAACLGTKEPLRASFCVLRTHLCPAAGRCTGGSFLRCGFFDEGEKGAPIRMALNGKHRRVFLLSLFLVSATVLSAASAAAASNVGLVGGGAFGEKVSVRPIVGPPVSSGPMPSVTLPSTGGCPFTANLASVVLVGKLEAQALSVSTQGALGTSGFVSSSAQASTVILAGGAAKANLVEPMPDRRLGCDDRRVDPDQWDRARYVGLGRPSAEYSGSHRRRRNTDPERTAERGWAKRPSLDHG